jgi:hypothetical protein
LNVSWIFHLIAHREGRRAEEGSVKRREAGCDVYVCAKWGDLGDRINPRKY